MSDQKHVLDLDEDIIAGAWFANCSCGWTDDVGQIAEGDAVAAWEAHRG